MRSYRFLSLAALSAACLFSAHASADVWTKAKVDLIGAQPDGPIQAYVYLTDIGPNPLYVKRFFRFRGANAQEGLAILLNASSEGRVVQLLSDVDVVGPTDVASIAVLYLTLEPVVAPAAP